MRDLTLLQIYLLNNLFLLVWTHEYLFYNLIRIHYCIICFLSCYNFGHWKLFHFTPMCLWRNPITTMGSLVCSALFNYVEVQVSLGSSYIFIAPVLNSHNSPRSLCTYLLVLVNIYVSSAITTWIILVFSCCLSVTSYCENPGSLHPFMYLIARFKCKYKMTLELIIQNLWGQLY